MIVVAKLVTQHNIRSVIRNGVPNGIDAMFHVDGVHCGYNFTMRQRAQTYLCTVQFLHMFQFCYAHY